MIFRCFITIFSLTLFFHTPAFSDSRLVYPLKSSEDQKRFQHWIHQTRCLVCKNQNIAESNASLAKDLRQKIYEQIKAGHSDPAIQDYLVERYGEFILFEPPFIPSTYLLWLTPFILLILAISCLFYMLYQRQKYHH